MTIYKKENGSWVQQDGRPWVKVNGEWVPATAGYVKRSGVWTNFYTYDATPPATPTLVATEYQATASEGGGRYIKLQVTPGNLSDTTLKRIRILVSTTAPITSQYDTSGYISGDDVNFPGMPWSEIWFNGYNGIEQTPQSRQKIWTRNATGSTTVAAGKYYFSAWAEDFSGNWSGVATTWITLNPLSSPTAPSFSGRYDATNAGTWVGGDSSGSFQSGLQKQNGQASPRERGIYFYGSQINEIRSTTISPRITSAQIYLTRRDDNGNANANVYIYGHGYTKPADIGNLNYQTVVRFLGTIAKGEAKWFDIPSAFYDNIIMGNTKGFGLHDRDPSAGGPTDKDISAMRELSIAPRSGEVYFTWEETAGPR